MRLGLRAFSMFELIFVLPVIITAQPAKDLIPYSGFSDNAGPGGHGQYQTGSISFKDSEDPSGRFFHIFLPGHHYTSDPGQPQMPVSVRIIEIPENMIVTARISELQTSRIFLKDRGMKDKLIYPSQIERTKNEMPDERVTLLDSKTYSQKITIKHDTVTVKRIGSYRGTDLYEIAVYPAFYNPGDGVIELITSMKLDISYSSKGLKSSTVIYENSKSVNKSYITGYSEKPVGLIIITDTLFRKSLKPFIEWKTISGYEITVLYKGTGLAGTTFDEIKSTLSALYSNLVSKNKAPQYLLIVGDLSIIPGSGGTSNVSDLYYSEFDGNGDYIPELFSGRLPVADTTQLKIVVKKIVDYEKYSYTSDNKFWKRALVTAGNDIGYASYMNGQVNYLKQNYFLPDVTISSFAWKYPVSITKDKEDSLKLLINHGLGILNYTGHGESGGLSDPTFKVSAISSLTNTDMYPLVIANACLTAQLSAASCFGKEMLIADGKGAVGYIGCTNDSYWSEDFYWAVGTGTPDITATYTNTGLGAFDRLFHTHNEDPSEWYYTLGQMNFAGNMSVTASTSSRKKYYWETYLLLGDPTMTPYIGKPDTLLLSLPDTVPNELTELTFLTVPFAYAALSHFDTLWDARSASPSGNVSLTIPPGIKDSCCVVITGQNIVPYRKTIYFGNISGEFLTYANLEIDDSNGNNDGKCDYGEKVNLSLTLTNLGSLQANNITTELSVASGTVTVVRDTIRIKSLPGGSSVFLSDSLIIKISDASKDLDIASLLLLIRDDKKEYCLGIDLTLHAPSPEIVYCIPDDFSTGNGNGIADPGEAINLSVKVLNKGSSPSAGILNLTELNNMFDEGTKSISVGILAPAMETNVTIPVIISSDAISGTRIPFNIDLVCSKYSASENYSLRIGRTRETWEKNNFSIFPWIVSPTYPWIITSSSSYENVLSARSASIPHSSESILAITVNNPERDTLSFHGRVSSEDPFDELILRIDSIQKMSVSGETGWFEKSIVLSPGLHYLEWVYKKDQSISSGLDAAWIDFIDFPDFSFIESDIKADTVYSPAGSKDYSNHTIKGKIVNLGRKTLDSYPLAYKVNDEEAVNETFYTRLNPGDTTIVSFSKTYDFSVSGTYNISIISKLQDDGFLLNDTAKISFIKLGPEADKRWVTVSPNPFALSPKVLFNTPESGIVIAELTDISGRLVYKEKIIVIRGENELALDFSHIATGVYILRIVQGAEATKIRIVKTGFIN